VYKSQGNTPSSRQQAVSHSTRVYVLGKVPDQEREQAFQDLLSSAQAAAAKRGGGPETGFSYSLAPRGAVYPFSEVEVVCLVQKADSSLGDALCSDFFRTVDRGMKRLLAPKQAPVE